MERRNNGKKRDVSVGKIAFYVKNLCKKDTEVGKVILVIKSKFCDRDLKAFADKYHEHCTDDNVRHVANLLWSVSPKNMDKYLQNILIS